MPVSIIVAATEDGVIGNNNTIPWRLPSDLRRFRRLTIGHPVIMGRKTYESLPRKPLEGRHNIVVTRNQNFRVERGVTIAGSLEEALRAAGSGEVFVLGGAELYALAIPIATRIYRTTVYARSVEGDTYFPGIQSGVWEPVEILPRCLENKDDQFETSFMIVRRVPENDF